eukprot:1742501-Rhodomonas_salina.2
MKLSLEDVLDIFAQRPHVVNHASNVEAARQLALRYGISEKTVRDVWCRKSRRCLTDHACTEEEKTLERDGTETERKVGRPPGAKDCTPRMKNFFVRKEEAPQWLSETTLDSCFGRKGSPAESSKSTSGQGSKNIERRQESSSGDSITPPRELGASAPSEQQVDPEKDAQNVHYQQLDVHAQQLAQHGPWMQRVLRFLKADAQQCAGGGNGGSQAMENLAPFSQTNHGELLGGMPPNSHQPS